VTPAATSWTLGKPFSGQDAAEMLLKTTVAYWWPATPEPRRTVIRSALDWQPTGAAELVGAGLLWCVVEAVADGCALDGCVLEVWAVEVTTVLLGSAVVIDVLGAAPVDACTLSGVEADSGAGAGACEQAASTNAAVTAIAAAATVRRRPSCLRSAVN
jgi:hypothetical protein